MMTKSCSVKSNQIGSPCMGSSAILDMVAQIKHHHKILQNLCSSLEGIADSLPDSADRQACLVVSRIIYPTVRAAHLYEEQELFPFLQSKFGKDHSLRESLERLRFEHWEDESFAEELSECLRDFATGNRCDVVEKLSYMIRGFFDGLKRHMAFETEHLLPLAMQANQSRASRV